MNAFFRYGRRLALLLALPMTCFASAVCVPALAADSPSGAPQRPAGPCDIYAAGGTPCVAAHSTTRALYADYTGPLYQVVRQSDGAVLNIGIVPPSLPGDTGGYADGAAQDLFCKDTICRITIVYDQSDKHNDLIQAPRGGFSGPALGGYNNLPVADMAPITVMGHKAYGVFLAPGMGLRLNDAKATAVDDQAEGTYWVIDGRHYNGGCCFDYGNAEIDSRDAGNGTMETIFYGNTPDWYHGPLPGPWIMTDQENNLVGCVNADKSNYCPTLPSIGWRFVTAVAKGEPHHWTTLGGDARAGRLSVMFDGPRLDSSYDPMRKQGAIVLGNGGDNSVASQGTFYEGAMTAAGTFPTDITDQRVQANIVAAHYDLAPLVVTASTLTGTPSGLQTFAPGTSRKVSVSFTNTTGAPIHNLTITMIVPKGWTASRASVRKTSGMIADQVDAGAGVIAIFHVKSAIAASNGDILGVARWTDPVTGRMHAVTGHEKVRNLPAIKINEFRGSQGVGANPSNAFIELYNAGKASVDISNWTVTAHAARKPIFSAIAIPAGTQVAPKRFYVLGLSTSGLAVAAQPGDRRLYLRSVDGLKRGDEIDIDTGASSERRTIETVGTAAGAETTIWQPVIDRPFITIPAGASNVPVTSTKGFAVGDKIALGFGATFPVLAANTERFEVVTITDIGQAATQSYLGAEALPGATSLQVLSVAGLSVGDTFRLDIASVGHGRETVKIKSIGTAATRTWIKSPTAPGADSLTVRAIVGHPPTEKVNLKVGEKLRVGTPASLETVTVTDVAYVDDNLIRVRVSPALRYSHVPGEDAVQPGTGIGLESPLQFVHAANLPFNVRGTGITFTPASTFDHSSNEPVLALGSGITLAQPLAKAHAIDAVVHDGGMETAGFQGKADHWFGGPALSPVSGNITLRDANGLVADSLNYGEVVDPDTAEGYQAVSGLETAGCFVRMPGVANVWDPKATIGTLGSVGRYPDGHDTDSNCSDFLAPASTRLAAIVAGGATNIKVDSVENLKAGQTVMVGTGDTAERLTIAKVGTAGAATTTLETVAGATTVSVSNARPFSTGQMITIGSGATSEEAVVASTDEGNKRIVTRMPLALPHAVGVAVVGSGISLTSGLKQAHPEGAPVTSDLPTPGRANTYPSAKK